MWIFMVMISLAVSYNSGYPAITFGPCPRDEYRVGFECCPLCHPGSYFVKDCTESSITKCSRCSGGTFKEGLDLKKECSTCTKCDAGLGLKVKKSCSSTSDAVCEVLDGFFCSDSNGGGCRTAQRHTVCSPGQYIGQRGTADKDTECLHCTDGTFSNGTSTSCQNHTKWESVGLNSGTDSTDSECGEPVAGIIPGVLLVIALMALIIKAIIHRKNKRGIYSPALTRDQQDHPTTIPAAPMDDHDGDQSLGPPQVPHNGSVSLPQHPEDTQTVLFRTDGGQDLCPPHSGSPLPLPAHPPHSGAPLPLPVHPPQSG
ncbi:tumor necrosis factor receptor superfamily member 14-like isoform X2 [Gadus morhua]|uniref:tumor necrosis factor receptor superfamily member 14-like isoform X2 n=1 Tax=Gadus morhua TaxID=8049 RepID=UPI0011B40D89|nr:tumor necrosis factor receptor superfamily member 14-like isoform X2 [Gadus morhua]